MSFCHFPMPHHDFLHELFYRFDKNHSGSISAYELQQALSNGSWTPFNLETVHLMMGMFDRDHSGTINFNEFSSLWKCVTDWQNCFRSFDRNNSGTIDRWELKNALTQLGYPVCDETLPSLMQRYGHYGSNNIHLDGFIHCCISLHNSRHSHGGYNHNGSGCFNSHVPQPGPRYGF